MEVSIKPEVIYHIGNFPITNTLISSWIAILIILILALIFKNSLKKNPTGKISMLGETIFEKFMDFLQVFAGGREKVKTYLPLVGTIFFYVLISNWLGTFPGVETIGFNDIHEGKEKFAPLFRTVFSDLNMTLVLALVVVISTHIIGFSTIGAKHHIEKFIVNPFKKPIGFFVGILELIGEVSRIISLTFRLFGNIFAGSVLMLIISHLVPYIIPIPFLGLELFVGFIQALVFAVLAMLFIASATHKHEEAH